MLKRKNKKGFTLAELLIVVAIIAVLVAIAVPLFVGALDEAKEATFDANQRALRSTAVTSLLEEKDQTHLKTLTGGKVLYATGTFTDGVITEITWSETKPDAKTAPQTWDEYKSTDGSKIAVGITQTDLTIKGLS